MASGMEFEGKNIEKAVQNACDKLNTSAEKLKYDVISYGSTGIFGLVGTKKAKIRVVSPKYDPNDKQNSQKGATNLGKEEILNEEDRAEIKSLVNESFGEKEDSGHAETNEAVEIGKDILGNILDIITTGAEISVEKEKDRILYNVVGGNPAILIGKKGQTLEAIQYLVEKVVNKKSEERIRLQVDIEGYLKNRRSNLESMSKRLADKAKRIGKPVTIGHMNSHDRRIVHMFLKEDTEVRTQSIGDGFYRKLVIFPRKGRKKRTS